MSYQVEPQTPEQEKRSNREALKTLAVVVGSAVCLMSIAIGTALYQNAHPAKYPVHAEQVAVSHR